MKVDSYVYNTLNKNLLWLVILWGVIAIMGNTPLTDAGSWAAIVAAFFAVLGIVYICVRWLIRKCNLRKLSVCYLIPQSKYPYKVSFDGAPEKEEYPHQLTVGIGVYTLFLEVSTKIDILFDPIVLTFEGDESNRPQNCGKDNRFVVERLDDGSYRDWWGNLNVPTDPKYPRYLYHGDTLIDQNRIETTGAWTGKIHIQVRVRETIIHRYLDFTVSTIDDDIPFLRAGKNQVAVRVDSVTNTSPLTPSSSQQKGEDLNPI